MKRDEPISRVQYRFRGDRHPSNQRIDPLVTQPTRRTWKHSKVPSARGPRSTVRLCSRRGLPCHPCYHERGGLLPHLFTLTHANWHGRFAFCCAFCNTTVTSRIPGCYPASCPLEPGLSST